MPDGVSRSLIDEMGMQELGTKCRKCGSPLHMKGAWTGCWECLVNKENARRGREVLKRIKAGQNKK
jgi:hypothetical protein